MISMKHHQWSICLDLVTKQDAAPQIKDGPCSCSSCAVVVTPADKREMHIKMWMYWLSIDLENMNGALAHHWLIDIIDSYLTNYSK